MVKNLNSDRDPSLVLNNDHDLSSSTPFLHIHDGQPLPALELGGYTFVNSRYDDCIECKKLTRPSSRSRHGLSLSTWYRYPLSRDLWRALLTHHEKSKHPRNVLGENIEQPMDSSLDSPSDIGLGLHDRSCL